VNEEPMPPHRDPFFATFPGEFDHKQMALWARELIDNHGIRIEREATAQDICKPSLDFGREYRHTVVDADAIAESPLNAATSAELERILPFIELVTHSPVVQSPHGHSRVTLKHYGPGDVQGWHYDTNPITLLFFLTDCPVGGELIVAPYGAPASDEMRMDAVPLTDVLAADPMLGRWSIRPAAGDILLMAGRRFVHAVRMQPTTSDRIILAVNLYHPDDLWRPPSIEAVIYGDAQAVNY